MNISPKERFLGICRFERPGDLFLILLATRAMRVRMPYRELKWEIPT